MKWYVRFKWKDIQNEIQYENKEFDNYEDAKKFYVKIREMTDVLCLKYGRLSEHYNPYNNIELVKEGE